MIASAVFSFSPSQRNRVAVSTGAGVGMVKLSVAAEGCWTFLSLS